MQWNRRVPTRKVLATWLLAAVATVTGFSAVSSFADGHTGRRAADPAASAQLVQVHVQDAAVAEGDTGTRSLVFILRLSDPVGDSVSVNVATFDSTATLADQDYEPISVRVTFPPASITESVFVPVRGDTRFEADEKLIVRLSNPVGAGLGDSEAFGTLANDDLPAISVADTAVDEGNSGSMPMAFRVRLEAPVDAPVSFHYWVLPGTATIADGDYEDVSGEGRFEPGQDQVVIEVPVLGDMLLEGNDRFTLQLDQVQGATPAQRSGIGSIRNDERATFLRFLPQVTPLTSGTLPPAWGDLEGDHRPDLPLYSNLGERFTEMPAVRGQLGDGNYHGAAWCDYDRDGDMDVVVMPYVTHESDYNFTHLFENTPTGLEDVAPAVGMDIVGHGETPSWGDFNADGWPDLFLPFYAHVEPFRNYFYLNLGGGQFLECADSAGVAMRGNPASLKPEGVGVADWNGDGTLDIYCASHLFLNDGEARFTDVRVQVGLPAVFDEGAQFVDHDNDGDLDLYMRTSRGPTLYRNDHGTFTDATATLGVGLVGWEWGDRWADLDSDGDLDLIFFPPGANPRLLLGDGDGGFREDVTFTGVTLGSDLCAFADFDRDGDIDFATGAWDRQFARNLLEQVPRTGTSYLKVRVVDDAARLTAHGATVRLRSLDDPRHPVQTRIVDGGSGYLAQDEYTITFGGVGSGTYELEVSYPSRPGSPRVVGPTQNPLLGLLQPRVQGPMVLTIRPSGQVNVEVVAPPLSAELPSPGPPSELWPPTPNPARHATRFRFSVPAAGAYSLAIHAFAGRKVRGLVGDGTSQGAAWDLRDDRGHDVPAGLYFARLERQHGKANVQRVVVLR